MGLVKGAHDASLGEHGAAVGEHGAAVGTGMVPIEGAHDGAPVGNKMGHTKGAHDASSRDHGAEVGTSMGPTSGSLVASIGVVPMIGAMGVGTTIGADRGTMICTGVGRAPPREQLMHR
jgi:hypothetical protein